MVSKRRDEDPVQRFFAYARERHAVHLRRAAGDPPPWTTDRILQRYRFCNVFRELDKTTAWFRKIVRDPLRDKPEVLPATVLFRWLNRIDSGEVLFGQPSMFSRQTAFEDYIETANPDDLRALRVPLRRKGPPYVTGSYTINTRGVVDGDKLEGVLRLFALWMKKPWRQYGEMLLEARSTLQETCVWLQLDASHFGPFMAYEVATDLRHTVLLDHAGDVDTWANAGPGARRGIWRLRGEAAPPKMGEGVTQEGAVTAMRDLLAMVNNTAEWTGFWPQAGMDVAELPPEAVGTNPSDWPRWELREVEHTLCEFDKYERVRLGQGRPRGTFNGGAR